MRAKPYKSRNIAAIKALTAEHHVAHTLSGLSSLRQDIKLAFAIVKALSMTGENA